MATHNTNQGFEDSTTRIFDDVDNTKQARLECSSISTGTTRTYGFPDADGTLMITGQPLIGPLVVETSTGGAETLATFTVSDDATAMIEIVNASGGAGTFIPAIQSVGDAGNSIALIIAASAGSDAGGDTNPIQVIASYGPAFAAVVNRDLLEIRNQSTAVITVSANGDTTFTGNITAANIPTLTSGTYSPTITVETNLDATTTATQAQYMRVGNTVTVSGRFTANPTLTATATSFEISLPVASNIGAVEDVAGVAFSGAIAGMGGEVSGVAANNTAQISWISSDITAQSWSFTFTYQII